MNEITPVSNKVTILMATYNGAKHIGRQLDSILNQTHNNWQVIIRDDGSTDDTISIIEDYARKDARITLIEVKTEKKGACSNFAALYAWTKINLAVNYLMFADQDDIWKSEKIEKTLAIIIDAEKQNPGTPLLAYGNLELVDDNEQKLPTKIHLIENMELRHLLTRNYAFGCTLMLNAALVKAMDEISTGAENHDYWVALFAAAFGKTVFIKEALILYRQHDKNVSGHVAGNQQMNNRVKRYTSGVDKQIKSEEVKLNMIESFYVKYKKDLPDDKLRLIFGYLDSFNKSALAVVKNMSNNGIVRMGRVQTLVSYYFILMFYKQIKYKFNRA